MHRHPVVDCTFRSFRLKQGRLTQAKLWEIASHGFSIRALEMAKLLAKMEFQDVRQLTSNLHIPKYVAELGAMQSLILPHKSERLLKQLEPYDIRRLEVI